MRTRPLLVPALVVLCVGVAHAWPPIPPRDAPAPALDQLIDRLAELRAQEAELQTRRADLERQVRDRLAEQSRRLQQVGVSPAGAIGRVGPPFHCVDVDRVIPQADGPLGRVELPTLTLPATPLPPDPPPPVADRPTFTPFSVEIGAYDGRERGPGWWWTPSGPLADRFDALGGLPLAYTRWWRDTTPRRGPEPIFHIGAMLFGGN